jgi:hypothetical protein
MCDTQCDARGLIMAKQFELNRERYRRKSAEILLQRIEDLLDEWFTSRERIHIDHGGVIALRDAVHSFNQPEGD